MKTILLVGAVIGLAALLVCLPWLVSAWRQRRRAPGEATTEPPSERAGAASDASEALVARLVRQGSCEPHRLNDAVNTLIHRGRYDDALRVGALPIAPGLLDAAYVVDVSQLLQVNLAEAEYNLGRWHEALARLEGTAPFVYQMQPLTRAALAQQRAWILVHLGRHDEGVAALALARRDDFQAEYHAEWHFTRGLVSLLGGAPEAADVELAAGLAAAVRPASERNGLFLRARARAALGDVTEAQALFACAAAHAHRHQGGDGLLAWGDLCAQVGRHEDARGAWELACARDPESASAAVARERLGALGEPPNDLPASPDVPKLAP